MKIIKVLFLFFLFFILNTSTLAQNQSRGYEGIDRRYTDGQTRYFDIVPTADMSRDAGNLLFKFQHDAPLAATVALAGLGSGNIDNGTHSYKITVTTATGETSGGTVSSTITITDNSTNGQISITNIPKGNGNVTSRKIYRTIAGNSGTYKLVGTLADNSTTIFTDNISDAALGVDIPTTNTTLDTAYLFNATGLIVPNNAGYKIYDNAGNKVDTLTMTTGNNLNIQSPTIGGSLLYILGSSSNNNAHAWYVANGTEKMRLTQGGMLTFGGITSSQPALKPNGTGFQVRLGDDSANGDFSVRDLVVNGTCTGCGSTTVGGSDTQVQFNNSGSFGGDSNFFWNNTDKNLTLSAVPPTSTGKALFRLGNALEASSSNAAGTYIGINTPNAFAGDIFNLQRNSNTIFAMSNTGAIVLGANGVASGNLSLSDNGSGYTLTQISNGSGLWYWRESAVTGARILNLDAANKSLHIGHNTSPTGTDTLEVYDSTASTGVTSLRVKKGAAQSTTPTIVSEGHAQLTHLIGNTSTPTIAAGAGAGTSPTVSISGTDLAGQINITSGTLPSISAIIVTVTFNQTFGSPPYCILWPANTNAAILGFLPYVNSTTTTFTVNAPTVGLGAATQYLYNYHCIQ